MTPVVDPLESRFLLAAVPTRYDVTIAHYRMTIIATGGAADVHYRGNSGGGGGFEEEYHILEPTLTVDGPLYVNGRRQPTSVLTIKQSVVRSLDRIDYRGTPGRDHAIFDNFDSEFHGGFDVALGGGADTAFFDTNDFSPAAYIAVNGGGGSDRIEAIGRTTVTDLFIDGGAGRDTVDLNSEDVSWRGFRRLVLDDRSGPTTLTIDAVKFSGGVSILTGPGPDAFTITDSTFTRRSTLQAGGGDDVLTQSGNTIPFAAVIDLGDDE